MLQLRIDAYIDENGKRFCVRDMRGLADLAFEEGILDFESKYPGAIAATGSFQDCVTFCAGFGRAIYQSWDKFVTITEEAERLRKELNQRSVCFQLIDDEDILDNLWESLKEHGIYDAEVIFRGYDRDTVDMIVFYDTESNTILDVDIFDPHHKLLQNGKPLKTDCLGWVRNIYHWKR